jgi:hypothetical protein
MTPTAIPQISDVFRPAVPEPPCAASKRCAWRLLCCSVREMLVTLAAYHQLNGRPSPPVKVIAAADVWGRESSFADRRRACETQAHLHQREQPGVLSPWHSPCCSKAHLQHEYEFMHDTNSRIEMHCKRAGLLSAASESTEPCRQSMVLLSPVGPKRRAVAATRCGCPAPQRDSTPRTAISQCPSSQVSMFVRSISW